MVVLTISVMILQIILMNMLVVQQYKIMVLQTIQNFQPYNNKKSFVNVYLKTIKQIQKQNVQQNYDDDDEEEVETINENNDNDNDGNDIVDVTNEEEEVDMLLEEINGFVLVNHLVWGIWAVNQSFDEGCNDFDYIQYAKCRIQRYWDCCKNK